jgi:hypothetical protein
MAPARQSAIIASLRTVCHPNTGEGEREAAFRSLKKRDPKFQTVYDFINRSDVDYGETPANVRARLHELIRESDELSTEVRSLKRKVADLERNLDAKQRDYGR